jgi:hypothetical protein
MAQCGTIKANGERCKGIPINGSQWCSAHHPEYAEARREHGRKGGKRGGRGRPTAELAALRVENAKLRDRLIKEELEPRIVAVAIQSINVDARLIETLLKARDQEELEERMAALEDALEASKKRTDWRGA